MVLKTFFKPRAKLQLPTILCRCYRKAAVKEKEVGQRCLPCSLFCALRHSIWFILCPRAWIPAAPLQHEHTASGLESKACSPMLALFQDTRW